MTSLVWRLLVTGTILALTVVSISSASLSAQTPEPQPRPPGGLPTPGGPPYTWCEVSSQTVPGGERITIGRTSLKFPAGYNYAYSFVLSDPGGLGLRICVKEFNSEIFINGETGLERSRTVNNSSANAVLDELLASVVVGPQPTPFPSQPPPPTPATQPSAPPTAVMPQVSTVRPPDTGDGGLR